MLATLTVSGFRLRGEVCRRDLVLFVALVLLIPSIGAAQVLQSFEDLPLRVNLNDPVQIQDESGAKVKGRVTRLTRDEITIQTSAGEKRFTRDGVHAAAIRGHALRRGALVGAGLFAVLGAVATCSDEEIRRVEVDGMSAAQASWCRICASTLHRSSDGSPRLHARDT